MFNVEHIGYLASAIGIYILVCNLLNKRTIIEVTDENFRIFLLGFTSSILWCAYYFLKYGMSLTSAVSVLDIVYGLFVLNLFLTSGRKEDARE